MHEPKNPEAGQEGLPDRLSTDIQVAVERLWLGLKNKKSGACAKTCYKVANYFLDDVARSSIISHEFRAMSDKYLNSQSASVLKPLRRDKKHAKKNNHEIERLKHESTKE